MGLRKTTQTALPSEERRVEPRDFAQLVNQLASVDPRERRWAARDLQAFSDSAPALLAALEVEADLNVSEAIFTSLQKLPNSTTVNGLLTLLNSDSAFIRNSVIEVLQSMPELVDKHIDTLLHHDDSDIRIFALDILQQLAHSSAPKWLQHVLVNETHINVLATAVDRITELGDDGFCESLQALKVRYAEEEYLTFAIDIALARLDTLDTKGAK
jgi:hypothetical protein